ncbi:PQQ-binding-like beta-propeller repeat protein [Pseudothermotoga thermarum]|uniref:Pyrrolo-quinoline quinone repeat-containing protein n=1 Tax=Pseudothermotoga thermarum DSM 5069 TaxID=688269 RepID=F7YUJ0_9THEM|nr:PQQ-binding-like beta-propeller repeat protein [Pseudothermotoga thermarum]AEH51461.1 Pyrrolo-quinoline quinone repeat-containing protein [Pseudothermotoga thermarum DSM 5069]
MKRSVFVLLFALCLWLAVSCVASSLANSPWPKFRGDAQNTGRSPYSGPQTPTLKWMYKTGGSVESSPVIGSDGTIYVGSWDKNVYALDPNGTLKWRFETDDRVISSPAIGSDGTIYVGQRMDTSML